MYLQRRRNPRDMSDRDDDALVGADVEAAHPTLERGEMGTRVADMFLIERWIGERGVEVIGRLRNTPRLLPRDGGVVERRATVHAPVGFLERERGSAKVAASICGRAFLEERGGITDRCL